MHYSQVTNIYSPANKLVDTVQELVKQYKRMLIKDADLVSFKTNMLDAIHALNAKFPRCKPVAASWWSPSTRQDEEELPEQELDWSLSFDGQQIMYFELKRITATYNEQL